MKTATLSPVGFFFKWAGYSYDPKKESPFAGRLRCARRLADAEDGAKSAGFSYSWFVDSYSDSSDWTDELPAWSQWVCQCENSRGEVIASLGAIDFGRDGTPWDDNYKRVVEAELAHEAFSSGEARPVKIALSVDLSNAMHSIENAQQVAFNDDCLLDLSQAYENLEKWQRFAAGLSEEVPS